MCGNMFVQFVLLFFTAVNYASGYGGGYHHKPYGFAHQEQHWPLEHSSEKPQVHATFGVGGVPYPPVAHWDIHQGDEIRDYSNPQQYLNQAQQYANQPQQNLYQPQQYINQPQQYANEPQGYVKELQKYANQPNHHANQPQKYVNQAQQYANQPQQNLYQPQQYINQPQQYANKPQGYVKELQQYANQPNHHANQPQQYVNQPQQYANKPQGYVKELQKYANQPNHHANQPQQYVNQAQQYANQPQQNLYQPQQYINQPQHNANEPQGYVKQLQQYATQPQQYVNQPQLENSSVHFYSKSTSPPTPLLPDEINHLQYLIDLSYYSRPSYNSVSEQYCYDTYVPDPRGAFNMGGDLTEIGEFPYMAAIGYRRHGGEYDYQCGGAKISAIYVLTAAHCRTSGGQIAAVVKPGGVKLGDYSIEFEPIEILDIIVHPNYKRKQVYHDIALLRLKKGINGKAACLWTKDEINYNTATAIGYGQTATRLTTSNDLFKVDLQLYSSQVCQAYYTPRFRIERGLIDSQICAGDFNKAKDTCPGDSGGPLLVRTTVNKTEIPFILGVTSFGPGCGEGIPGVYTKVSSYLDWIEPIVWPGS